MSGTLQVKLTIPSTPKGLYDLYHKRYYKPVEWKEGNMTLRGFRFRHRFFKSLNGARKEAERFGQVLGQSTTIIRLTDGRHSFLPSNQEQNTAIERVCRMLGAQVVTSVTVLSL